MFRPNQINELRTPATLLTPTLDTYNGVATKRYPDNGKLIFVNLKSKGGTETVVNGVYSIIDTAEVVAWWNPEIKSDSRLKIDSDVYEIKGTPENINNQFMILKVEKISGGA